MRRATHALVIVDETCTVVSATPIYVFRSIGAEWALDASGRHLCPDLVDVVHSALDEWLADVNASDVITLYRNQHVISFMRLAGIGGQQIAISFALLARRATLRDEAERYDMTPREYDVLRLAIGGFSAAEIAAQLVIAEATAQVYLKRLLQKTNARNRAQMVAMVLGSRMSYDVEVHDLIGMPDGAGPAQGAPAR